MRVLHTIWLFCLLSEVALGQFRFRTISIEDGLTENSITDIFQDSEGYMWFGTQDGISRYDGYVMKNFNISGEDSTSLSDNFLWGFGEDSLGYIWCCSRYGVNRIDKVTGACKSFFTSSSPENSNLHQATSLEIYKSHVYAVFAGKLYRLPIRESYSKPALFDELVNIDLGGDEAFKLFQSELVNKLYVLTTSGVFDFEENSKYKLPNFNAGDITTFLPVSDGDDNVIWFSNGKNLYTLSPKTATISQKNIDLEDATILDIGHLNNQLWLATDQGVWLYVDGKLQRHIVKDEKYKYGLTSNYIPAVYVDKLKNVWLGTSGNGVCLYESNIDQFKYLGQESLGENQTIRSMVQRGKSLYLCSEDKLYVVELSSRKLTNSLFLQDIVKAVTPISLPPNLSPIPTCLGLGNDSSLLIGAQDGSVLVLSTSNNLIKTIESPFTKSNTVQISSFCTRNNGDIWATTFGGIIVFDSVYNIKMKFEAGELGITTNYFLSVFEDLEQKMWLGSNVGVFSYQDQHGKFEQIPYNRSDLKTLTWLQLRYRF